MKRWKFELAIKNYLSLMNIQRLLNMDDEGRDVLGYAHVMVEFKPHAYMAC